MKVMIASWFMTENYCKIFLETTETDEALPDNIRCLTLSIHVVFRKLYTYIQRTVFYRILFL
jgi:hypothetical protein